MDLIDKEDDLAGSGNDFVDYALEPLLKLTLVFGTRNKGSHVKRVDLFLLKVLRYVASYDTMRQTFGDSGLADTRFADQNRVVLRSAAKDLQNTSDLVISTDNGIQFAFLRPLAEVDCELLQVFVLVVGIVIVVVHSCISFS